MEFHQLRYFLAVADAGSFTEAADRCNISQPSLSAQIAKLENEVGGPLFLRSRVGARLTERGVLLRPHAIGTLRQRDRIAELMDELSGLQRGTITLGSLPSTGAYLLPTLLPAFRSRYPAIAVELQEATSPKLAAAVRDGDIDVAVLDDAALEGLDAETLFTEPLFLALPAEHPLAERSAVELPELEREPLVLMKRGHGFRTIVDRALNGAGVEPLVIYESSQIDTVQAMVASGIGVSIVPSMVRRRDGTLRYAALAPSPPTRSIAIARRAGEESSPAARAMWVVAKGVLTDLTDESAESDRPGW